VTVDTVRFITQPFTHKTELLTLE